MATNSNAQFRTSQQGGWGHRGADIYAGARQAQQEAADRRNGVRQPGRFGLKKGEEAPIIILDNSIQDGFAFWEHKLQINGSWNNYRPCLKDLGVVCPHCQSGDKPYYVIYLTCLVLKPFTTDKGEVVNQWKGLLGIKITQLETFEGLERAAVEEGQSLRGMYLQMRRPLGESTSHRIGEPSVMRGGRLYEMAPENELLEDYGSPETYKEDGTVRREANYLITPFNYDVIFPRPDVSSMQRQGAPVPNRRPAGSVQEAQAELQEADQIPMETEPPVAPAPSGRQRPVPASHQVAQPPVTGGGAIPPRQRQRPAAPVAAPAAPVRSRRRATPATDNNPFES